MDLHEALLTRRTAHLWRDEPVPETVVERALAAAHLAPCHRFTWPWHFVRVGAQSRAQLFEIALRLKSGGAEVSDALREKVIRKVRNPAHLIVVTQRPNEDPAVHREDYAAIACAIQNLSLSVHADGFASKWSTGGLTRDPETYSTLGLNAEEEEIVGFVWVGVPENADRPTPRRSPLERHIRQTD